MAQTKAQKDADKKKEAEEAKKKKDTEAKAEAEALAKKKKEAEEALAKKKKDAGDAEEALAIKKNAEDGEETIGPAAASSGSEHADEGKGANGEHFLSFLQEQLAEEAAENDNGAKAAASSVEPETKDDKNKDSEKENPKKESMLQISRLCNICRECLTEGDALRNKYRCKNCASVAQRISRLVRNDPGEDDFTSEWMDTGRMTADERRDFYVSARDYIGPRSLKAAMESKIEEIKTRTNKQAWSANSTFLDEVDIRDKYKNKPDIIESILKKAEQFHCPIKGCVLYEDIVYANARVTETTEARHVKRSAETTENMKGEKQKRQKKAIADKPKAPKALPPPPKLKLSQHGVDAFLKTSKQLAALSDKIDDQMDQAKDVDVQKLVPAFLLEKARTVKHDLQMEIEMIDLGATTREAEKTLKKSNKKMREEADEIIREMGQALASALNHIAKQALE